MANLFHVNIITPAKVEYEGEVSSLIVPAHEGYLGVLAHHASIIAKLKPGRITLRAATGETATFGLNSGGFLEFSDNKATLLLDSLEKTTS